MSFIYSQIVFLFIEGKDDKVAAVNRLNDKSNIVFILKQLSLNSKISIIMERDPNRREIFLKFFKA